MFCKLLACAFARSYLGLKWRYVPEHLAVLLDKIYKFENKTYELGGEAAQAVSEYGLIVFFLEFSRPMGIECTVYQGDE